MCGITTILALIHNLPLIQRNSKILCFDLSNNGPNTGIPAKESNLQIDISCSATPYLVADVFCIYFRSVITIDQETRVLK